jgi:hypothetical protein
MAPRIEDEEPLPRKAEAFRGWFGLIAFGCLLTAGGFYLLEYYLKTNGYGQSLVTEITRHLCITFAVACVSILGIETIAKARAKRELAEYRKRVSENVFEAVLGRIVPDEVIQEINEMLRNPFVKLSPEYTIRFLKPYADMSQKFCVVRRDLHFIVKNVSAERATFPVHSAYTSDENLHLAQWGDRPFHLKLVVDGREIPEADFLNKDNKLVMHYEVDVDAKQTAEIFIQSEEPMRLEANRSFYYQSTPVDRMEVVIENQYQEAIKEVEVQMHHPGRNKVEHDQYRNRHVLRRAFFPGQGFEAIWRNKSAEEIQSLRPTEAKQINLLGEERDQPQ